MIARIRDWVRPYVQLILLFIVIIVSLFLDWSAIIIKLLKQTNVEASSFDAAMQVVMGSSRWIIMLVLIAFLLRRIWKCNSSCVLSQTNTHIVNHSYAEYWICRYILGYRAVSLTRVPIPMQFKLVCRGIYLDYKYDEGIVDIDTKDDNVKEETFLAFSNSTVASLVLADTYPINPIEQLPKTYRKNMIILIDRSGTNRMRYYSPKFRSAVVTAVRNLPPHIGTVHVFATLNPKNCYNIAKDAFSTGGRDSIKHIYVHQQRADGQRCFEKKGIKIY